MKKTIFICTGNFLLFTLMGLAFLFPFSQVHQTEFGFGVALSMFPFLLLAYFVIYPVTYWALAKKCGWKKTDHSELSYQDERERLIVAESTKTAYLALVGGLLVMVALIGGVQAFSLFSNMEISIYMVSIASITVLLNVATIAYCIKWYLEYKK